MAGYTRQDTNDNIATGKVINASDFDNEFDQIVAAFHASTGHSHDGTTAEGPRITVIGPSGKFSTDTNAFFPTNTTTVGLGKTDKTWTDLYVDNIKIDGNVISSTDTDGNISLTPNGAGSVILPKAIQIQDTSADHQYVLAVSELAADRTVTLPLLGGNDEFVFKDHTQTLTNKTLTAPVFGGISTTASGNLQVKPATNILEVQGDGTGGSTGVAGQIKLNCHVNSHGQTIEAQPHSTSTTNTMLLPQGASSTLVSRVSTDTLTNKTLTSPVLNTGISGTAFLDDDTFGTATSTTLASSESIKAYVDAQNTAQDLDIQGDSGGALSIDLDDHTLDIAGGTGIDTSGSGQTITVAIDSTVATLTGSQILTNKTLTLPQINDTSSDHQYVFAVSELAADRTVTLPLLVGNDEFVFKDHAQTLTNKTLTSPKINENVALSATATELDRLASVTSGSAVAGKAVTLATGSGNFINDLGCFKTQGFIDQGEYNSLSAGTHTLDWTNHGYLVVLLTGNVTLVMGLPALVGGTGTESQVSAAAYFTLKVVQDGTGSRSITWPSSSVLKWAGGTAPTLTGTANSCDVFTFFCHDTAANGSLGSWYGFTAGLNVS